MKKLYIVALFHFRETHLMEAAELLNKLVTETRKEAGCLQYDLIEDQDKKGIFFLMELWENEEYHYRHLGTEHLEEFRKNAVPLLESETQIYKGAKLF